MIVNEIKPTLETSNDMKEIMFGIGDASIIFDVLRSKLYSNPLQSVCREITCNARDTMIAAGKRTEPIQITLPNTIEPTLKIRDWGEGISPDRIESIFVMFGSSTKRDTNDQVGFFGLGSKSIGSITDSYTIETTHNGTKYHYAFAMDETKLGKLLKLSEEPTTDINGTEIAIPIKSNDFAIVRSNIEFVCRHWETKPIIKGGKIDWQTPNWILEESDWKIASSSGYARAPKLIIEGIEYPLDLAQVDGASNLRVFYEVKGDVFLYWKTGELSLSASREAVHLDKSTSDKIVARAKRAYKELEATLQAKIANAPNLKQAYIDYTQLQSTISSLPAMEWQGTKLSQTLYVPGLESWYKHYTYNERQSYLRFGTNDNIQYPIFINDLQAKPLVKKEVSKLFAETKSDRVLIVNATNDTIDDWETKLTEKVAELKLEELGATYLSEVISIDPAKPVIPRMTVFKFDNGKFGRVKYLDFKNDKQDKVLCVLHKNTDKASTRYTRYKGNAFSSKQMNYVFDDKAVSVYGLDENVKPDKIKTFFKGCKTLDAYVKDKFAPNKEHHRKVKAYKEQADKIGSGKWCYFINAAMKDQSKLNDDVKKLIEQYKVFQGFAEKHYEDTHSYEVVMGHIDGVSEWIVAHKSEMVDVNKGLDKVFKRYPLLSEISSWAWSDKLKDIIDYMSMCDERTGD